MSDVIFEVGDVVTCAFYGDEEFVLLDAGMGYSQDYTLAIRFFGDDGIYRNEVFTKNGLRHTSHTASVLKLVRKKIKNRVIIELFKVNSENESFLLENNEFGSYEDAFDWIKRNGVNGWVYSIDKFYKIKDL